MCSNLPRFIVEGDGFPGEIEKAVSSAFLQTDAAFADACSVNSSLASGTTVLAALITGRYCPNICCYETCTKSFCSVTV